MKKFKIKGVEIHPFEKEIVADNEGHMRQLVEQYYKEKELFYQITHIEDAR